MDKAKKDDITKDEKVDTNANPDQTGKKDEEPTLETVTFQKNKALGQRDILQEEKDVLQKEFDDYKVVNPLVDKKDDVPAIKPAPAAELDNERLTVIEFTVNNPDLTAADVAEVASYAKGTGKTLAEAKDSPVIKAYLQSVKDEKELDDATPEGGRSPKKLSDTETEVTLENHEELVKKFKAGK